MNRFTGKKVLVTGGNSGMGFDTAKEFIREGEANLNMWFRVFVPALMDAFCKANRIISIHT